MTEILTVAAIGIQSDLTHSRHFIEQLIAFIGTS